MLSWFCKFGRICLDKYSCKNKIFEFDFILQNSSDKIILEDIISSILITQFQIILDIEKIVNDLKLDQQYSFKYDWNQKDKVNFIELSD